MTSHSAVIPRLIPQILARLFIRSKIGRKHKPRRQQAPLSKPWRNTRVGRRGPDPPPSMGNEESTVVDESTPSQSLTARSLEALAQYIKDGRAQKIVVMVRLASSPPRVQLTTPRPAQALALPQAYQTSAPKRRVSTPISRASNFPTLRPSSTYPLSATTPNPSTP